MKTSCISHPPKTPLVIIRQEYVAICNGDHCEAAILNQFEYWSNIKLGHKEQAETESEIARAGGLEGLQGDLWIYKTQTELHEELMGLFGIRAVGTALQSLVDRGFLERRNNPKYAWDRTYQYRLGTGKVQDAILQKCKMEKVEMQSQGSQKRDIEPDKIAAALPEITSKTTSEITEGEKKSDFPEKTVRALADLFDEVGPETPEEIDTELRDAGYDPNEVGARMKAAADQAIVDQIIEQTETHPGPEDLARATKKKQAEAGGNYAIPSHAGGDDCLADAALFALYSERGKKPPRKGTRQWEQQRSKVAQALAAYGYEQASLSLVERAAALLCERKGDWTNVFHSSFPMDFGQALSDAEGMSAKAAQRTAPRHQPESALLSQEALQERQAAQPPPPQDDAMGRGIKADLKLQVGRNEFQQYVRSSHFACEDGTLVITAPSANIRDWLENRLGKTIKQALAGVADGPGEVVFEVSE